MSAPFASVRDVRVRHGDRTVLAVDALTVERGEILVLLGPNGAGKSTLLRVLTLLEPPSAGEVLFEGSPVGPAERAAWRQRLCCCFQEPLLLDATALANAALPLRLRGVPRREAEVRARRWLERLGVAARAGRRAATLSGGEAQRVSLARALALEPELLGLDEPFAALDPESREPLLEEFLALQRERGMAAVLVTHDRAEALRMGDRIAVLLEGRLAQVGPAAEVFTRPVSPAVARLVGADTILEGTVLGATEGLLTLEVAGHRVQAVGMLPAGERALLCLRPEDVTLLPAAEMGRRSSARNNLPGRVTRLAPAGPLLRVHLDCGTPLTALVTRPSAAALGLVEGAQVIATFKASAAHCLPRLAPRAEPPGVPFLP
ncbi:MAG TPA: ABC transporter ATP-binding protein [Candidatus Methylomirabilis sp.]|nr:ABC transporter ATP-binding protein [Candidatus Methylomirabilis sp.]